MSSDEQIHFGTDRTVRDPQPEDLTYTAAQAAWMKENEPLRYTGNILLDLPHLPQHLRFDG